MKNAISWFEIPVIDFGKAKNFYEAILDIELILMPTAAGRYGMFPFDRAGEGIGGAIVQRDGYQPSADGSVIYLNAGEDLNIPLSKIEARGGKVIMPKTAVGEFGYIAMFMDTEGNKVAFLSNN